MMPSDSQFRNDAPLIVQGKVEEAEKAKVELEELQRADKRGRIKAAERRKNEEQK